VLCKDQGEGEKERNLFKAIKIVKRLLTV
jgi:hypothetical protein